MCGALRMQCRHRRVLFVADTNAVGGKNKNENIAREGQEGKYSGRKPSASNKNLMVIQRQSSFLPFFPVNIFIALAMHFHRNAIINRANQLAKIATNTFFIDHRVRVIRFAIVKFDRLVRCVFAGYITKATVNTFILVDRSDMMIINVEVLPVRNGTD